MCTKKLWVSIIVLIILVGCSTTRRFTQGRVIPTKFHASTSFFTARSLMIVPCELDGQIRNFIFDTGAQVTAIQRDSIFGEILTIRGGSNRTVENGSETVKSIKIGGVDFVNTFATNGNGVYLKERIPDFGGVLGRTIIDKANWLVDYQNGEIQLSNDDLSDHSYSDIPLVRSLGTLHTSVEIRRNKYPAIIDLGSNSIFNVPQDTELALELMSKYPFVENVRERYTVGGNETITELIGTVPLLTIGDLVFRNVQVNINLSSQIRLGIEFFKDYLIYIDNSNHRFRIKLVD